METNVNLNDIITMVNIIDTCSERGAFKGNELAVIGTLREKLANFVRENQKQEAPQNDSEEESVTEESAE